MIQLIQLLEAGVVDSSGVALANGTVTCYTAGTTTLQTMFQDRELETPHPNPATLDAAGKLQAFVENRVKLVISNSAGAVVRTIDNIGLSDSDVAGASISGAAGNGLDENDGQLDVQVDGSTITITDNTLGVNTTGVADGSTIEASGNTLRIKDGGVGRAKLASLAQEISSTSGTFTTTSDEASPADVTGLSVTLTTTGRPVFVGLLTEGGFVSSSATNGGRISIHVDGGASPISQYRFSGVAGGKFCPSLWHIHPVSVGTHTYKVTAGRTTTGTITIESLRIVAFEL